MNGEHSTRNQTDISFLSPSTKPDSKQKLPKNIQKFSNMLSMKKELFEYSDSPRFSNKHEMLNFPRHKSLPYHIYNNLWLKKGRSVLIQQITQHIYIYPGFPFL